MSRRTIAIAAALSVLAFGSPLIIANANPLATQYFNQGLEKYEAGNYQEAIADFTKAIEINPQDAGAYRNRGIEKDNLEDYFANLKGYDQRVDFDLNALTISPKKIIGGFFDIEKIKFLETNDIEVINIPLRHRWVLDGGIHCYTLDIDRYE